MNRQAQKETREGFIFSGTITELPKIGYKVSLLIEGLGLPRQNFICRAEDIGFMDKPLYIMDRGLQKWLREGLFEGKIPDNEQYQPLLLALRKAQEERQRDLIYYRLMWRFLPVVDYTSETTRFIFTTDTNHLDERDKLLASMSEEKVRRLEDREKRARERKRMRENRKEKARIGKFRPVIIRNVLSALEKKTTSKRDIRMLQRVGLLGPSGSFRSSVVFIGERHLLRYDFKHNGNMLRGFIGFDKDLNLISIDGRTPERVEMYLGQKAA